MLVHWTTYTQGNTQMSARDRLEDARVLFSAGRQQGAFVAVLVAAAATARKRYPSDEWDDSEAFRNFIYDEMGVITGGPKYGVAFPFQRRLTLLEDLLYYHLRCQLVHEGSMPETIVFKDPVLVQGKSCNAMHLGSPLGFPVGWIDRLATAVWLAPENDDLWKDEAERRKQAVDELGSLAFDRTYCRRPGSRRKVEKGRDSSLEWTHGNAQIRLRYPPTLKASQIPDILEVKAHELRRDNH